jgi:DNA-binding CsgD family transcriptional regulator
MIICHSQIPSRPFIIHYGNRDYHADFQNWSVSVSPDKTIFIGNNLGLLEFDGANWTLHEMPDQLIVRSVSASNDSVIYVGAYEEFGFWKKTIYGDLNYFSLSDSIPGTFFHNDEIWRIIPFQNKIYFQSFSSIYVYDGSEIEILRPGFTIVLLQTANDRLFIHGVDRGLYELKNKEFHLIEASKSLAQDEIKVVLPFDDNRLLIGASQKGLFIFEDGKLISWNIPFNEQIQKAGINNGIKIDEFFVIGTIADGIFIIDREGNLVHHLNTNNLLHNNTVLSLESDNAGNFWAALFGGVEYVNLNNDFSFYFDQKGELGSVFTAALYNESLWIGSNRGLYEFQVGPSKSFDNPRLVEGLQGPVWTLQVMEGELWCGHNNGTYKIIDDKAIKVSDHNGGFTFKEYKKNEDEFLIQSTYSPFVVFRKKNHSWEYSHTIEGFLEPINFFELDFRENIWANHATRGIFKIKLNDRVDSVRSFKYIGKNEGMPIEKNLFVAKLENRIVFTTGEMIYTYDDLTDTIIPYQQLNNQINEYRCAKRIIPIRDNHYWFVLPDKIGWFVFNEMVATRLYEYNLVQQGAYLNTLFPKISILNDTLQLLCLENGFALLEESKIKKSISPPNARLEKIVTLNRRNQQNLLPIKNSRVQVELKYEFRNIEFTFSTDERTLFPKFSYYLEGLEEEWNPWKEQSLISYTRLPYGNYTFYLKTMNERCLESNVLSYSFMIRPPWYASNTATVLYILTVLIFGFLLRIVFLRRLKRQSEKLAIEESMKRQRERLAAEQKYIKLKNEKLQSEIKHQNIQLANRAMAIIQKNELMLKIKRELTELKTKYGKEISENHFKELIHQIDGQIKSEDEWNEFELHFDQANQNFFKRLKKAYPDLTSHDLRLCAYLRMNLSSKEIAPLLGISVRGVEIKRYRLRKRLNLDTEENLIDFLITF